VGAPEVHARVRAKQTIPPAVRRAVLARDQRRCRVPGCANGTFLDVHHIQPRSEGGRNEAGNLLTLCSAHHRAAHRGELLIDGNHANDVRFRHADGSRYGELVTPRAIETESKLFWALRNLGFREPQIRPVLAALLRQPEARNATPEWLLREAVQRLTG
jgi:hypothetical protein